MVWNISHFLNLSLPVFGFFIKYKPLIEQGKFEIKTLLEAIIVFSFLNPLVVNMDAVPKGFIVMNNVLYWLN